MVRALTNDFKTALVSASITPIFLFRGDFGTGGSVITLRLWSGMGDLSWGSETWLGNGWFRGFQGVEESSDISSTGMDITLAGVPQTLISMVLSSARQNALGELYFGLLDSAGGVIADPCLVFEGRLDVPTIDDQVGGPIIQISYESRLVDLDRSKEYRYTPESQRIFNATDKGFDYVANIAAGWKGQWGPTAKAIKKKESRAATKKKSGGQSGGSQRK